MEGHAWGLNRVGDERCDSEDEALRAVEKAGLLAMVTQRHLCFKARALLRKIAERWPNAKERTCYKTGGGREVVWDDSERRAILAALGEK